MYDVTIIGGGVIGCAIARELSRYNLKIQLLEKEDDVCSGTSKANSAIVHAGYDAIPGSNKAKYNVLGNKMMSEICKELEVPFIRKGSLVVCTKDDDDTVLYTLLNRGIKNGVEGLQIIERDEILKLEPNIADDVTKALFAPSAGIICPFTLTIAYAENAFINGVEFHFESKVIEISKKNDIFNLQISTPKGVYECHSKVVINAAGVYADSINNMISKRSINITPRKGEYILLDVQNPPIVNRTIFKLPSKMGKGILVTPTVFGNVLLGPTAENIKDKEDTSTTHDMLKEIQQKAPLSINNIPFKETIRSFSGLRASEENNDFIIEESDIKGFFNVAGIESPGLSSAPAIGDYIAKIVADSLNASIKEDFISKRSGLKMMCISNENEKKNLINSDSRYGNIICRCSFVSEAEIIDAIRRPLGARTVEGIKKRTGSMMGRCQGGFCLPKIIAILAKELNISEKEVKQNITGSEYIIGENKKI